MTGYVIKLSEPQLPICAMETTVQNPKGCSENQEEILVEIPGSVLKNSKDSINVN